MTRNNEKAEGARNIRRRKRMVFYILALAVLAATPILVQYALKLYRVFVGFWDVAK